MKNGTIRTASLEHALDGTVRRTIVDICRRENIPLEETSPNLSEIDAWKVTNSPLSSYMLFSPC